jgi:23S rRNA pseudouridine1911/1915/1917 synthase
MQSWTCDGENMRLDVYLAGQTGWSRIRVRDAVRGGAVMVNGRIARKAAMIVRAGDTVELRDDGVPMTETRIAPMDLDLTVLYEDDHCLVLNKPAGIPVHPGAGIPADAPTILHGVVHVFAERTIPFASAAVLVHRLDKDTTGCLLIAKSAADHKALQKQFEARTIGKTYLALVAGRPQPASAVIDAPIGRHSTERTKMTMLGTSKAREAKTTYRTLASGTDVSLVQCDLHTGRTHQLRVHLAGIGSPILGDPTYGTAASEKIGAQYGIDGLRLHAWKLSFQSPSSGETITVTAPLPRPFTDALARAGIDASAVPDR